MNKTSKLSLALATLLASAAAWAADIDGKWVGKVGKDGTVSFNVVRNLNNAETKVAWTGKLAGDELKLTRAAVGQNQATEVVAKRSK